MGTAFNEIEPLLVIGLAIAVVGSVLGILWYRVTAPSSFDAGAVRFIILMFSGIGLGTVVLGYILKH